jgi:hypothetical protein
MTHPLGVRWSHEQKIEAAKEAKGYSSVRQASMALGIRYETLAKAIRYAAAYDSELPSVSSPFVAPSLPSADEPLEALIARRRATAERVIPAHEARDLIPVRITMPGPIGLLCQGDPHLDNDGSDFPSLEADLRAIANQPRVMALSIGDVTDNWVGRLERLYALSSVKAADAFRLAEWMFSYPGVNWLGLVSGNHDKWSGHRDPLKWITKARVGIHEDDVLRMALNHPCGAETRIHARHDFKGSSIWNDMHGLKREVSTGWRDHLLVAGHRHLGEDGGIINADGFVTQLLRLSGYKRADSYATQGQFKAKPMHPSALVIINPNRSDNERGRVWVAPDVAEGVDYLKFITRKV